jgi:hypothetical protein
MSPLHTLDDTQRRRSLALSIVDGVFFALTQLESRAR